MMCNSENNFGYSRSSALAVLRNKNGQCHYMFEDRVVIGRSPTAFLCLVDGHISRKHCVIEKTPDNKFTICDTSNTGTFVNDKKLVKNEAQELKNLDCIKIGTDEHSYMFLINKKRCYDWDGGVSYNPATRRSRIVDSYKQWFVDAIFPGGD